MSGTFQTAILSVQSAVLGALTATPTGWDAKSRNEIVPGELAWDECECGLFAIQWQSISYTQAFPNPTQRLSDGCRPFVALALQLTVLRCAPNPGTHGEAPSADALTAATWVQLDDAEALLTGTSAAGKVLDDANQILQYALAAVTPLGPQGGCVGVTQQMFLGFANRWGSCQ